MDRRSLLRGAFFQGLGAAGAIASLRPASLLAAPLEKVKALGALRVGLYADNRPWSWEEKGKPVGIDVDLAHALAEKLGARADIALFTADEDLSDDLRNVIWRGGLLGFQPCDVMLHVPFDRQLMAREDNVTFLAPYYRESFGAACGPELGEAADCEAMPVRWKGKRIAAELDSIPDFYLLGHAGGALSKDVVHVPTGYEAVMAVGKGEADAAVASTAQIEAALHDAPDAGILRRKGFLPAMLSPGWDIGIAVKENSRNLGFAIEEQFAAMAKDGRMKTIFAKYGVEWKPALASQTS